MTSLTAAGARGWVMLEKVRTSADAAAIDAIEQGRLEKATADHSVPHREPGTYA
jgi:hypothetical protein